MKGVLCTMVEHNPVLHLKQAVGERSGKMYFYLALEVRGWMDMIFVMEWDPILHPFTHILGQGW
jgi:hypothetical protein